MERMKKQNGTEDIPLFISRSNITTEINKTGSWRFARPKYDEKTSPCSAACPAGEDIARIQMLANQESFKEAVHTILIENPFPAVCGRVCFHPCETACNRTGFDEPIAIRCLERFLGDFAIQESMKLPPEKLPENGKSVCIAGAGPAGLAAGYFLTRLGYSCHIFEASSEPGGILRWGIPEYRLPVKILAREIERIKDFGVKINCNVPMSQNFLKETKSRYDAFFIACGYSRSMQMNIPGDQAASDGLEFLRHMRREEITPLTGTAAVVGGGNTAVDIARSLVRLGLNPIIVYRRRKQDMPAFKHEVEMARKEGVKILELFAPIQIEKTGGACFLTLQQMKISGAETSGGRAVVVPDGRVTQLRRVDHVFTAIGAEPTEPWQFPPEQGPETLHLGHCTFAHRDRPLMFGGDLTNPIKSVTDAIASGKQAAMALDAFFKKGWDANADRLAPYRVGSGPALSMESYLKGEHTSRNRHIVSYEEINTDYFSTAARVLSASLAVDESVHSFLETEETYTFDQAVEETYRCFKCGICDSCNNCRIFCPEVAVVFKDSRRVIDLNYCKGCGICVVECPRNAMALEMEI
jgi:NADPH-dependent glutamate synthase beta subunit-like oxidoreductase/ferredoxin